jgi:UDP-glucose 4-epimerase
MRIAVTGIASDFGKVIAPLLFADPEVEEVIGIDLRAPRLADPKLRFEQEDVRSSRMGELFSGCEAVVHLAFVVAEIHDKRLTHSINLGGSKNVIAAASYAGVRRLVIASSVASYGAHADYELPITEDEFPRGNPDKYYFYDKAEVEHYIDWWLNENPGAGLVITRIRPPGIVGPSFDNALLDRLVGRAVSVPADTFQSLQLLWEGDLATAFAIAAKRDSPGPFNLGTDDRLSVDELAALHGQRVRRVPPRLAAGAAELLFRLRLSPVSADWVVSGESIVSIERARAELGWSPRFSSAESARMLLVQRGRPILPGRSAGVFGRKEVAEEALAPLRARHRAWARSIPGLCNALDGPADVDRMSERVEHVLLPYGDLQVHLELHSAAADSAPSIVFSPGIGGHSRFYLPLLGKLCDAGFNVIGIDRPGHGLSEGRRGDCTVEEALDVIESAATYARRRFGGPVALLGSSLGGILSWYALTREPDVEAVVCHNIAHPGVPHEPAARLKIPVLKRLARAAPFAGVPIKRIANFHAVADSPEVIDYFHREEDEIWAWKVTARSIASLYTYRPPLDWSAARVPVMVLVGESDRMVTRSFTEQVVATARPEAAEVRVLEGAGHMLFIDHLDRSLPVVVEWLAAALAGETAAPPARAAETTTA